MSRGKGLASVGWGAGPRHCSKCPAAVTATRATEGPSLVLPEPSLGALTRPCSCLRLPELLKLLRAFILDHVPTGTIAAVTGSQPSGTAFTLHMHNLASASTPPCLSGTRGPCPGQVYMEFRDELSGLRCLGCFCHRQSRTIASDDCSV